MVRFAQFVEPVTESGCWLWTGMTAVSGYGKFVLNGKKMLAHQVSYELFVGKRKGLFVLHSCDVRCCVNPNHLRLGTSKDNATDASKRKRYPDRTGTRNGRARITEEDVLNIRASTLTQKEIGAQYGLPQSSIFKIKARLTWKHV